MSFYFIEIDQKLNWSLNSNVNELELNFQAGVDSVYDAVTAKGSTPASKSLSDVIEGINNIKIKWSYNIIKLLGYPGYGNSNYMTADKDYIAVIFMVTGNTPSNVSGWMSRCSCNGGSLVQNTYFSHAGTGYGGNDSYLGVKIYTDVPKGSSISNYMGTVYGIYES